MYGKQEAVFATVPVEVSGGCLRRIRLQHLPGHRPICTAKIRWHRWHPACAGAAPTRLVSGGSHPEADSVSSARRSRPSGRFAELARRAVHEETDDRGDAKPRFRARWVAAEDVPCHRSRHGDPGACPRTIYRVTAWRRPVRMKGPARHLCSAGMRLRRAVVHVGDRAKRPMAGTHQSGLPAGRLRRGHGFAWLWLADGRGRHGAGCWPAAVLLTGPALGSHTVGSWSRMARLISSNCCRGSRAPRA